MNLELSQILTQIVAFLIMLAILKRFLWKPMLAHLDERKQKIIDEFDLAKSKNQEADARLDEYNGQIRDIDKVARSKIQEAINQGQTISQEIVEKSQHEAKEIISKAQKAAEQEIESSKVKLRRQVAEMAIKATEKLLKEQLDPARKDKLIQDFVHDLPIKQVIAK